jgi:hypothetical protein
MNFTPNSTGVPDTLDRLQAELRRGFEVAGAIQQHSRGQF